MLKQHKNILFDIVKNSQVPLLGRIESFYKDEPEGKRVKRSHCFVIHILDTPLSFWVWPDSNTPGAFHFRSTIFWANFPFGPWQEEHPAISHRQPYKLHYSIEDVAWALEGWINSVVVQYFLEEALEDNWELLKQYRPFISDSTFTQEDLQPFSLEEKEQIRTSLQVFQELLVQNYNPNEEQLELIEERLDYLSKALDRLNRFDWKGVTISTVIGIGINLGVDTNTGATLLRLLEKAFQAVRLLLT